MTIQIESEIEEEPDLAFGALLEKVVRQAAKQEACPYELEVNLLLVGNDRIRELNREYRQTDKATDVLSFPLVDYEAPARFAALAGNAAEYFNPETEELVLGDIIISLEQAKKQALLYGHSLERELAFLAAHSMLHLFGYDHMEEEDRLLMEGKQEQVLAALGISR